MSETRTLFVYGQAAGRADSRNIREYLDREGFSGCHLVLSAAPHESVAGELGDDGRIEVVLATDPGREAKARAEAAKQNGAVIKLARLEEISQRPFSHCPC